MRRADVAMYVAKRRGLGYTLYTPEEDQYSPARLALTHQLRHAIEQDELRLYFQPVVSFATGRLTHVEALVRWQHPEHGMLPPDQFVPLAEQIGLINALSAWVIDAALRQCAVWRQANQPVSVSINLSARNLHDPQLPQAIVRLLEKHGVPPEQLTIELTESMIMGEPARALETLSQLNQMGVGLSIDDYGTGYSSLAYLKRLPMHELKIDKSFVLDMVADENDAVIVRSTIDLGHNLGLQVVAEGVENREIWERLATLGCDQAQGYYLARPMPAEDLAGWMQQRVKDRLLSPASPVSHADMLEYG